MTIKGDGNVGIGITNPSDYDGRSSEDLVVGGTSGSHGITIVSGTDSQGQLTFADGASGDAAYRGRIWFDHNAEGLYFTGGDGTGTDMVIMASGKVGIGDTDPSHTLVVKGVAGTSPLLEMINSDTEDGDTGRESTIRFSGFRSTGQAMINSQITGTHDGSADDDDGMLTFFTNAGSGIAEKMRIDSDGKVGIGTNAPASTLVVTPAQNNNAGYSDSTVTIFGSNTSSSNYSLKAFNSGGEGLAVRNDGIVQTSSDFYPGADVVMANGRGISFTASSNTGGMSRELLDDYEEGTFTATLRGSTGEPGSLITSTVGNYTKIGRNVTIGIAFENRDTTGYSGYITVTGLPFNVLSHRAVFAVALYNMATFSSDAVVGIVTSSGSTIEIMCMRSADSWATVTHNASASSYGWIMGTYIT